MRPPEADKPEKAVSRNDATTQRKVLNQNIGF
jgi:hypothetical protein